MYIMKSNKTYYDEDIDDSECDEFHGDITEEEIENVVEIFDEDDEPDLQKNEYPDHYYYRTENPEAPPMDELFDESDKKQDYDDEYEK